MNEWFDSIFGLVLIALLIIQATVWLWEKRHR